MIDGFYNNFFFIDDKFFPKEFLVSWKNKIGVKHV